MSLDKTEVNAKESKAIIEGEVIKVTDAGGLDIPLAAYQSAVTEKATLDKLDDSGEVSLDEAADIVGRIDESIAENVVEAKSDIAGAVDEAIAKVESRNDVDVAELEKEAMSIPSQEVLEAAEDESRVKVLGTSSVKSHIGKKILAGLVFLGAVAGGGFYAEKEGLLDQFKPQVVATTLMKQKIAEFVPEIPAVLEVLATEPVVLEIIIPAMVERLQEVIVELEAAEPEVKLTPREKAVEALDAGLVGDAPVVPTVQEILSEVKPSV